MADPNKSNLFVPEDELAAAVDELERASVAVVAYSDDALAMARAALWTKQTHIEKALALLKRLLPKAAEPEWRPPGGS